MIFYYLCGALSLVRVGDIEINVLPEFYSYLPVFTYTIVMNKYKLNAKSKTKSSSLMKMNYLFINNIKITKHI